MGVLRGIVQVPYGRRGVLGPRQVSVGGDWPFTRCRKCGDWKNRKGEHYESISLVEYLKRQEDAELPCPSETTQQGVAKDD